MGILFFIWTWTNRTKKVVAALQPIFLYIVDFGSIVSISVLIVMSQLNEDAAASYNALLCQSQVWLLAIGTTITIGALMSKTYRVKLLMIDSRSKNVRWAQSPGWFLVYIAISICMVASLLAVQTAIWPVEFRTICIGEGHMGECVNSMKVCWANVPARVIFYTLLSALGLAIFYLLYLCYLVRSIPPEFSEHRYIVSLMLLTIQGSVIMVLANFFCISVENVVVLAICILFLREFSTLVLIFGPCILAANEVHSEKTMAHEDVLHNLRRSARHVNDRESSVHTVLDLYLNKNRGCHSYMAPHPSIDNPPASSRSPSLKYRSRAMMSATALRKRTLLEALRKNNNHSVPSVTMGSLHLARLNLVSSTVSPSAGPGLECKNNEVLFKSESLPRISSTSLEKVQNKGVRRSSRSSDSSFGKDQKTILSTSIEVHNKGVGRSLRSSGSSLGKEQKMSIAEEDTNQNNI